ncbi:molybdate ABC transporter permease subunit [Pseudodesulfovibrio tunisiensis]|uniref:molybdate ABC transporter permease subunit n=1 Tax=Pseudodesulfovibrio tunisiensis TaxID=463192 RepID=UPI001FB45E1C|nr:ABC transporter permease subunit [Pseudodesulfovibrio tunisiensis]
MDWLGIIQAPSTIGPVLLTLKVLAVAGSIILVLGLLAAYYLAHGKSWMRSAVDFLVTLPLVFPPIATGFALLLLLGRDSAFARATGLELVFSFHGVVLASVVAGLPLMVKPVEAALRGRGKQLAEAAYVLGKNEWQTFVLVLLPNIRRSVIAGWLLALGRSLGEVGMTLMLGGNVIGKTNTLSLEIYNAVFSGEFDRAIVLSCLIGVMSLGVFVALKRMSAV